MSNPLIKSLIITIEKLQKTVDKLQKIENEKCVMIGCVDEGGYSEGGRELKEFEINVDIIDNDEYYTNGLVSIDIEMILK